MVLFLGWVREVTAELPITRFQSLWNTKQTSCFWGIIYFPEKHEISRLILI